MQEIYNTPKRSKQDCGNTLLKAPTDLCSKKGDQNEHSLELLARKRELTKIIQTKEESLRKLKLVKMYRNKVISWTNLLFILFLLGGVCGRAFKTSNSDLKVRGSSLARRVFSYTRNFSPLCLCSPRCIYGYR